MRTLFVILVLLAISYIIYPDRNDADYIHASDSIDLPKVDKDTINDIPYKKYEFDTFERDMEDEVYDIMRMYGY